MTDEEFERLYGRRPVRAGTRKRVKVYWGRVIIALIVLVLIICGLWQLIRSIYNHFKKGNDSPAAVTSVVDSVADSSLPDESSQPEESVSQAEPQKKEWQFKVCIDPGHGGADGGACLYDENNNVIRAEKDDTLRISLALRDYLLSEGVSVCMTRETDIMLHDSLIEKDLDNRCTIANDAMSDLFVSLHRDSVTKDVSGFECWAHNKKPEMDTLLAQNIMSNLQDAGISNNRGVSFGYTNDHAQNYHVNADVVCPSVLCELGFITSEVDNKLFDQHIQDYAKAIGDALIKTAQELNVVDANGKRILNEQLISKSKLYYPLSSYYSSSNPNRYNPQKDN